MSDPQRDVANMRRLVIEVQQDAKYETIEELVSDKWFNHTAFPGTATNKAGIQETMKYLHATLNDVKVEIIHCVSDGKVVATNKVLHGKFVGEFAGRKGKGENAHVHIMDFVTVDQQNGKFVEHWHTMDFKIDE